jgi:hypothetical protein
MAQRKFARTFKPYRTEGLFRDPINRGDSKSENGLILKILRDPSVREIMKQADQMQADEGRPWKYQRSSLIAIHFIRVILRLNLREARRRVQTDPQLRAACGFGPISERAEAQRIDPKQREIREDDFPSRTEIRDLNTRWLAYGGRTELLGVIEHQAHVVVPYRTVRTFDGQRQIVVADVTRAASGLKRPGRKRVDGTARRFRRGEHEEFLYHRQKATILLPDLGLVIAGVLRGPESEHERARELAEKLTIRSAQFASMDADAGLEPRGLKGAAVGGDTVFSARSFVDDLERGGLFSCASVKGGIRTHVGLTTLSSDNGTTTVDYCNDGTVLCSCSRDTSVSTLKRRSMKQTSHQWDATRRGVVLSCTNPICPQYGRTYRVDRDDIPSLNPLDHSTGFFAAVNFHARQMIEHYHKAMHEFLGLAANDHRAAYVVLGDTANEFLYLIGDLIWNLIIEHNLTRGIKREPWKIDELAKKAHRNTMAVKNKRAARVKANTEPAAVSEQSAPDKPPPRRSDSLDDLANAA